MIIILWWVSMCLPISDRVNGHAQALIEDIFIDDSRSKNIDPVGHNDGVSAVVGKDRSGLPMLVPVIEDPRKLDLLPGEGQVLGVTWPGQASFVPRALTVDAAGSLLVVADDFNIYAGKLPKSGDGSPRHLRERAGHVTLEGVDACRALAGNLLKDVAVVCAKEDVHFCRLLVIVGHGKQLIECPLNSAGLGTVRSTGNHSWQITQDWLEIQDDSGPEQVESIAANFECVKSGPGVNKTGQAFSPKRRGCAVVGTSRGRIVQIREGAADHSRLIPTRVMHSRNHPSSRGALTLIRGMYQLALWSGYSTLSAFEINSGKLLKEWRLPTHLKWIMVSGSTEHLFILGVRNKKAVEIYRFPMPEELRNDVPKAEL